MRLGHAVQDMLGTHAHYAQRGQSLATAALAGARDFVRWAHHPREDAVDAVHASRFYYHAHDADEMMAQEHGHFHVFVTAPDAGANGLAHLVGISMDAQGLPLRLFTTNGWVTGEAWTPAEALREALLGFRLVQTGRLAPVARWITAMVQFYAPVIEDLLRARDAQLQSHPAGIAQAWQDRAWHITSQQLLTDHWQRLQKECEA